MEGPVRKKQVLCLGAFRTGTASLAQALVHLGYKDVYHYSTWMPDTLPREEIMSRMIRMMSAQNKIADATLTSIPSFNAQGFTRAQFDTVFGPAEVISDVMAFAIPLIEAYPEAKVILVRRDFDSWVKSFVETMVDPVSYWRTSWLSGWVMEPLVGVPFTRAICKNIMGWTGVSTKRNMRDRRALRLAYDRHYENIRRAVPPKQLLELNLKEMEWEPICDFLGKEVPDTKFPRVNESAHVLQGMWQLHRIMITMGTLKLCIPWLIGTGGFWLTSWLGLAEKLGATDEDMVKTAVAGGLVLLGFWWAIYRGKLS